MRVIATAPEAPGIVRSLLATSGRPLVMGIVNVTPDSFYPGSRAPGPKEAVARGVELVARGADLLDVGGESTRPGSDPVPVDEELARVVPVVEGLAREVPTVPISIDTRRASVADAALEAGASIVNDVSAGRDDEAMFATTAEHGADIVLMHMQGTPKDMQEDPRYDDVVAEVAGFLLQRAASAVWNEVPREAVVLDPGIGFGKRLQDNLALLQATSTLSTLGYPLLVGASRKSLFQELLGRPVDERLSGSLAVAAYAVMGGASVLRVHDVVETADVVKVICAVRAAQANRPGRPTGGGLA